MIALVPGPLRLGSIPDQSSRTTPATSNDEVPFRAYGADCIVSGHTALDAARLTDMLNAHDAYLLADVTVERFEDGESFEIAEITVLRDDVYLVQATDPRGDVARRYHTQPRRLALKVGPYKVRGAFHGRLGAEPLGAMRRRMTMVPLTEVRIEYTCHGETRETRVDTVIVNREQIDWVQAAPQSQAAFPMGPPVLDHTPASRTRGNADRRTAERRIPPAGDRARRPRPLFAESTPTA
jgi:hypothetical protein